MGNVPAPAEARAKSIWFSSRFQFFATGTLIQNFSQSLYVIALPLLVYELTHSAAAMSSLAFCETLPMLVLGPITGAVIDRISRRFIIYTGLLTQVGLLALVSLLQVFHLLHIWELFVIGAMVSVVGMAVRNAQFTIIPLVFSDRKIEANAGFSTIWSFSMMFGSPLAGIIIAWLGPMMSITCNAILLVFTCLTQVLVRIPDQKLDGIQSIRQVVVDTKEGFTFILKQKVIVNLIVVFALSNIADNGLPPIVLYHLKHNLHLPDQQVGLTMGAAGIGLFIGSLFAGRLNRLPAGKIIFWFLLVNNAGLAMFLFPSMWAVVIALFTFHLGGVVANIIKGVVIQTVIPDEYMGRATGTIRLLDQGTQPLSVALLGFMASAYNTYAAFATAVVLSILCTLVMVFGNLRHIDVSTETSKPSVNQEGGT